MDKNVTLVRVTNWNSCSKFTVQENGVSKEVTSPSKYLGIVVDSDQKVIPITGFKDFHVELLEFFAKSMVIGDKDHPVYRPVKPKPTEGKK